MNKSNSISVSTGTIVKIIVFVGLVWVFIKLINIFVILLTSVVLASAIEPMVRKLILYKIPRAFSVLIVYFLLLVIIVSVTFSLIPAFVTEARQFATSLPTIVSSFQESIKGTFIDNLISSDFVVAAEPSWSERIESALNVSLDGLISFTNTFFNSLLTGILIAVLTFYFAVQERNIYNFLDVISPRRYKSYVLDLWGRSREKIGQWMKGQIILGFIIAVLVYLGLLILGVKYALLFAIIAGLFELIPIFGPILSAILPVLVGFVDGGWVLALLVVGLFVIIQQLENNLIYPLVVTKVVGIPSILVIIAIISGWILAGFLGVVLAVPLSAILQEFINDLKSGKIDKFVAEGGKG